VREIADGNQGSPDGESRKTKESTPFPCGPKSPVQSRKYSSLLGTDGTLHPNQLLCVSGASSRILHPHTYFLDDKNDHSRRNLLTVKTDSAPESGKH
jgi:hypothetical protein